MRRSTGAMSIGAALQRQELRGFPRPLDPIHMPLRALLEKRDDADARLSNPTPEFLQLRLQEFVFGALHHLQDAHLQCGELRADRVRREVGPANSHFATLPKIGARPERLEELIHLLDQAKRRGSRPPHRASR